MKKFVKNSYFALVLGFIYFPIIIMIVFSFNSGNSTIMWNGFTLDWYADFLANSPFIKSIITSLFVAVISTIISVVIGTMAAIGLSRSKKATQRRWLGVANVPLINADIVTAVSLMIVFIMVGVNFGIVTLIMAHVSFNVPYVLITVMPRLRKIDPNIIEAAEDLGASQWTIIFKIILPILKPAIITASAIAFAMSFDDFIISFFTGGGNTTASSFIYSNAKKAQPYIFAFGTMLVGIIIIGILTWNAWAVFKQHKIEVKTKIKNNTYKNEKIFKLEKKIDDLKYDISTQSYVTFNWNPINWVKLIHVRFLLRFAKMRNYNTKITHLEWKASKLKSEIQKEQRYELRLKKANKKMRSLNLQLNKTKDVKRAARLTIQIEKLQTKIDFLIDEIAFINNREKLAKEKAKRIQKEIKKLQKDLALETEPNKKTINWYNKKIKELEDWKIEVLEGRQVHKLKETLESLKELRIQQSNKVIDLTNYYEMIHQQVWVRKSFDNDINYFETKYNNSIMKINDNLINLKVQISKAKDKLTHSNDENGTYKSKGFFARSWKTIMILFIGMASFGALSYAYVINNIYDIVVGNWGAYIDPKLIGEFERKYNKKVNYQPYTDNETLYNKLYTFEYDIMVPSDYMVQKLANEGRIQEIDWSRLNVNIPTIGATNLKLDIKTNEKKTISDSLIETMNGSKIGPNDEQTILNYAIPYFWGDLVMVVNPTESNKEFLKSQNIEFDTTGQITSDSLQWDLFWEAGKAGKKLAINSDPKNVFMISAAKAGLIDDENHNVINLKSKEQVNDAGVALAELMNFPNISLNGDDLINKVSVRDFDFALMYNGDAAYANMIWNGDAEPEEDDYMRVEHEFVNFIYGRPKKQKTNIFSDNMVISKNTKQLDTVYLFINFMIEKSTHLSDFVGIASPYEESIAELTEDDGTYSNYKDLYIPSENGIAFTDNKDIDKYLIDRFNSITGGK